MVDNLEFGKILTLVINIVKFTHVED